MHYIFYKILVPPTGKGFKVPGGFKTLVPAGNSKCPETCKCLSGGAHAGGKEVNAAGYCNYYCSEAGYCGEDGCYETESFIDCTGCAAGNKPSSVYYI